MVMVIAEICCSRQQRREERSSFTEVAVIVIFAVTNFVVDVEIVSYLAHLKDIMIYFVSTSIYYFSRSSTYILL